MDNIINNLEKKDKKKHKEEHNKGKKHPMFGKTHSKKSKELIIEKMRGENHPQHMLMEQDVIEIKKLLTEWILTQKEIAEKFGVSPNTISAIKNNRRWNHV